MHSNQKTIIKNLGLLQYSQQEWEIQIDLELDKFFMITELIQECRNEATELCKKLKDSNCIKNIEIINNMQIKTRKNIYEVKFLQRPKRFEPITGIIIIAGITVMSLISAFAMQQHALNEMKETLKQENELLQKSLDNIRNELNLHEKIIGEVEKLIQDYSKNVTSNINLNNKLNNIMLNLIVIIHEHDNYFNRIKQFYLGNLKQRFFSIIDLKLLTDTIREINIKLNAENLRIPELKTQSDIEFIKLDSKINNIDQYISLRFPILYGKTYNLFEMIPVPTLLNDELNILNMDAFKYIRAQKEIMILDESIFSNVCNRTKAVTICNSIMESGVKQPNTCEKLLIETNSDNECFYKPIENKQYFIRTSDEELFIYTNTTINIDLTCANITQNELKLKGSREILFPRTCLPYKFIPEFYFKGETKTKLGSSKFILHTEINLYDIESNKWIENVTIIEKYQIHLIKLKSIYKETQVAVRDNRQKIEKIKIKTTNIFTEIWETVKNFISETIIKYTIIIILVILGIIILLKIISKLIGIIF